MKIKTVKEDRLLTLSLVFIFFVLIVLCSFLGKRKFDLEEMTKRSEITKSAISTNLPEEIIREILKYKRILQLNEKPILVALYDKSNIPSFDETAFNQNYNFNTQKNETLIEFYNLAKEAILSSNNKIAQVELHDLASLLSYIGYETFSEKAHYNDWLLTLSMVSGFEKQTDWQQKHFYLYSNIDFKFRKEFSNLCPLNTKASKSVKQSTAVGLYYSACYSESLLKKNLGHSNELVNAYKSKPLSDKSKSSKTSLKNRQLSIFALPAPKITPLEQLSNNFASLKDKESEGKRKVISFVVYGVANIFFDNFQTQKAWIETVINANVLSRVSSDGAYIGLSSLNSSRIEIYRKNCHLPSLTIESLNDTFTNLYVSACAYKTNLETQRPYFSNLISYLNPSLKTQIKDVVANNAHMNQTQRIMDLVHSPLHEDERYIQTILLSLIANKIFDNSAVAKDWPIILGIESKFDNYSVSSVGAMGIGQLMPAYAKDFARSCELGNVTAKDLEDVATNAYVSACYYKYLSDKFVGLCSLSLVAYNAGPNSKDVKSLSNLSSMSNEPANYVSKFNIIKDLLASGKGQSLDYFTDKNRNTPLIELTVIEDMRTKYARDNSFFPSPKSFPSDFRDISRKISYLEVFPLIN